MPTLLYGLKDYPLQKYSLYCYRSSTRLFMKLFKTDNMETKLPDNVSSFSVLNFRVSQLLTGLFNSSPYFMYDVLILSAIVKSIIFVSSVILSYIFFLLTFLLCLVLVEEINCFSGIV